MPRSVVGLALLLLAALLPATAMAQISIVNQTDGLDFKIQVFDTEDSAAVIACGDTVLFARGTTKFDKMSMAGCRSFDLLKMKIWVDNGFLAAPGPTCWAERISWSMTVYVGGSRSGLSCGPG